MLKKILLGLGGFVFLILAAIIVIPLVVDVDQYRPQVVKAVNDQINGKFDLGKMKLNLWGRVRVQIDGLKLADSQGNSVVSVQEASFDMPYWSIFSGSPLITLSMDKPEIKVLKSKDGKMNVLTLMKESPKADASNTEEAVKAGADQANKGAAMALPAMALNARIGVSVVNAKLVYSDAQMSLTNTIDDLNIKVKDLSLSRPTEMEVWANLKTQMGKDLKVEGPLKLVAMLKSQVTSNAEGGGEVKGASVEATFNADDLDIQQGSMFHKTKGIPANFKFNGSLSEDQLNLKEAAAKFHNAEIVVKGQVKKASGAAIEFNAKPIEIKAWSQIIPMLKEYELEGLISLEGNVKGQPEALQYAAQLAVKNFSLKGPYLKAKPVIQAEVDVVTDKIQKMVVQLKGPGNDLMLTGTVAQFKAPQVQFNLKSTGMDLDQWIDFPKQDSKAANAQTGAAAPASGAKSDSAPEANYDAMLDPLRKNEIARATVVEGNVNVAFFKAMNVRLDQIEAKIQFKNLIAALSGLKFQMFGGTIQGGFSTDLKPAHPPYNMNLKVSGFDMAKAVESQFQSFKNTIIGKLDTTLEGGGTSFNPGAAKKNLKMKGNFKIANPTFKSMDIAKVANEGVKGAMQKLGDKVPALKGRSVNVPSDREAKYELVASSFVINNGFLEAPDFIAKPAPKGGIDIRGFTKMGIIDESLDAKWELIDTYGITGANGVNVDIAGKSIKNVLAKGESDPVILPVKVGCKWSAPCSNYSEVPEYLAGVAAGRIAKGAGEAAKAKAASAVQDAVKKAVGDKLPANVGDKVQGGLKKLFGR